MNNQTKLEFRLVPTKGVASGKGFRAEWTRKNEVLDMDAVIAEAQAKGAFVGFSAGRARSDIETLFDTMIANVLKDGRTRKLDGYLEAETIPAWGNPRHEGGGLPVLNVGANYYGGDMRRARVAIGRKHLF